MMYMRDCLRATSALLAAPEEALTRRVYNVAAMSFTPEELAAAIQSRVPGFEVDYDPDFRQVSDLDTPTVMLRTWKSENMYGKNSNPLVKGG